MNRDNKRIMSRRQFDGAARQQIARVAAGDHEFAGPLQRDQCEDDFGRGQAACRSVTQLAVKPGPSAVSSERGGKPCVARAFEHEQHGRRRHVAVVGDHLPLMVERALMQRQRGLQRADHPGAAGMADEAVDIGHRQLHAFEDLRHRRD